MPSLVKLHILGDEGQQLVAYVNPALIFMVHEAKVEGSEEVRSVVHTTQRDVFCTDDLRDLVSLIDFHLD